MQMFLDHHRDKKKERERQRGRRVNSRTWVNSPHNIKNLLTSNIPRLVVGPWLHGWQEIFPGPRICNFLYRWSLGWPCVGLRHISASSAKEWRTWELLVLTEMLFDFLRSGSFLCRGQLSICIYYISYSTRAPNTKRMQANIQASMAVRPSALGVLVVTLLKMLTSTRNKVTRRAILPGITSIGMRKDIQDTITNRPCIEL